MSFCPLIRDECKKEECMFWIRRPESEWIRCAFQALSMVSALLVKEEPPVIEESNSLVGEELPVVEDSSEEFGKKEGEIETVASELKKRSPEELAKELVDFVQKQHPKAVTDTMLQHHVFDLFWINKGLPVSTFYRDPELERLKTATELLAKISFRVSGPTSTEEEVAKTAAKIFEELKEELKRKTVDEIVGDVLNFWKKNISNYIVPTSLGLFRDYLRERGVQGVDYFELKRTDAELEQKLEDVIHFLTIKLSEEREKESAKKMDELVKFLLPKFKNWLAEKGISRVSRNVVDVFLQEVLKEGSITLPPIVSKGRLSDTIYVYAKTGRYD
jgi:flagellin-specific chaperone FliS